MRRLNVARSAGLGGHTRRAFGVLAGTGVLASFLVPCEARAEGSAQLGQITEDYSGGLRSPTVMSVDVLDGDEFLNIVARGEDGDDVDVVITAPDGTQTSYTLTDAIGELTDDTLPATLPSVDVEPLQVAVEPGRYTVQFSAHVEPFDITLTEDDATVYDPTEVPEDGGRLSSRDWRFFGDLPGTGEVDMNANFYVRATVGDDFEFVWELDFQGLLGGQMCLTANNLGLPGEFARSSQPFSALDGVNGFDATGAVQTNAPEDVKFALCDDLSQYDIYLNVPNNRKPEPPAPEIEDVGIGACGAIVEGMGGTISFDASLEGTYLVVIDVDKDSTFDPKSGDVAIGGTAEAGTNSVVWDGLDADGNPVAAGEDYAARVFLRLGEFHFTGTDIEAIDPGIIVNRVDDNDDADRVAARISWDDEALSANNFNNAAIAPSVVWSTPDGAAAGAPHAWRGESTGGTQYDGPGENSFIDSWVFGAESVGNISFDVLEADADLDGDGLVNGRECEIGSFVSETDSDEDGVGDYQEEPSNVTGDEPVDTDEDGIPDALDEDDDGDGVPTALEEPSPDGGGRDTDNDGTPDYLDDDDDGDGVPTALENPDPNDNGEVDDAQNSDEDDLPDYLDDDDDNDGIGTESEGASDSDPDDARDTDEDDVPDYLDDDDDDDGIPTAEEGADDNENGSPEDAVNTDGSGPPDYLDDDDDGDGIPTEDELTDADNNGTPDYLEPPTNDSDGDGVPNDEECPGSDDCEDTDEDGDPDFQDTDDDNDGVLTRDEDVNGDDDPSNDDTDEDGIPDYLDRDDDADGVDTEYELADPEADGGAGLRDSDDDGTPDYLDPDDDDDGVFTVHEASNPDDDGNPSDAQDSDNDGKPDYLDTDDDDDGALTEDEGSDPNGDGDPADARDSDDNGTPDYLQPGGASADGGAGDTDGGDLGPRDTDGDGLFDDAECPDDTACLDSDGDGKPNFDDADDDNDGILTSEENADVNADGSPSDAQDTDTDGKPDYLDADDDNDGINTLQEGADPNGDGSPEDARDADADGKPDYLDNDGDPDMDGIPTTQENADPNGDGDFADAQDSDGDGSPDYNDADDDGDGVLTRFEQPDPNGDGVPNDGQDTNGDGRPDYLDPDDDGDGVLTRREVPDRNTDGDPRDARDTDGDGTPDYLDRDDDGDGKPTPDELGNPENPRDTDRDGKPDYLDKSGDRDRDDGVPDVASIEGGGFGCAVTRPGNSSQGGAIGLLGMVLGAALWSRRRRQAVVSALAAASVLAPGVVSAQTEVSSGFSLNRFNPAERGSDWFSGESLDLRGSGRVAVGIVGDWAYKPLVSYDESGEEVAAVIENQVYAHAGLSVNLWDRVRLAASFPVLFYQSGNPVDFDGTRYQTTEGVQAGDLRLGLDLRLFGEYGDAATMAIGAQVHLPTGNQAAYTSDEKVRFMPRAALAGDAGILAYAVQVGLDARTLRYDYADQAFGTDLRFGASLGLRLADKKLLLGPELWGSTVLSDDGEGLFEQQTTPLEGVLGGHYFAGDWRFGLGVGPGFTRGFGSPALRVLGVIEWFPEIEPPPPPPPEPEDTDGDGILDPDDACPAVPGVSSSDPTKHGCPVERKDTDKDGIYDDEDACVDDAGVASDDPKKNGCPPDTDGDTILDRDDACVDVAGEPNRDRSKNGCPPPKDSDGDGIIDPEDVCPDKAGPPSDDPAKHGCPRAQVEGERVIILDRIEFDTGKATIRPESEPILDAVRAVLSENPQIKKLRVEGHTDNKGGRAMNIGLSRRRAAAVVQWLVEHGIEADRLTSQGVGPDRPIDDNGTDDGRQNNRRVEFHIVE